ncbi:hypothetical protein LZ32DRAFT_79830 [Colletotrichum eremochloae]|nr:hypothetical protein LZ32DRAFT_79830 [Colletotrichum eremochloae]
MFTSSLISLHQARAAIGYAYNWPSLPLYPLTCVLSVSRGIPPPPCEGVRRIVQLFWPDAIERFKLMTIRAVKPLFGSNLSDTEYGVTVGPCTFPVSRLGSPVRIGHSADRDASRFSGPPRTPLLFCPSADRRELLGPVLFLFASDPSPSLLVASLDGHTFNFFIFVPRSLRIHTPT